MTMILLIVSLILDVVCLVIVLDIRNIKRETRDLLLVIREWAEHGKEIREDTRQSAGRVERKVEQLAVIQEKTAKEVVEKISSGSAHDSAKFPAVKLPPSTGV